MTWSLGASSAERFEMARAIVAICRPKRRRPGRTHQGFQKALARLPMRPLVALAGALRHRLGAGFGAALLEHGSIPLCCEDSRLECPRTDELLRRLPKAGKDDSASALWVTASVHLTTGGPGAGGSARAMPASAITCGSPSRHCRPAPWSSPTPATTATP